MTSRIETYNVHLKRLLNDIDSEYWLNPGALSYLNEIVTHLFNMICRDAVQLTETRGKKTIGTNEIVSAIKILFGDTSLHTVCSESISSFIGSQNPKACT